MNVLDLFSGIGGFSLGLERAGMRTVAFCECDDYARAVLRKHWPSVPCYDDVRTLTAERLAADGIAVDVICGGFPCQDISVAGKGAGLAGARSKLWSEYARLIGELRPRFVIVENVAALLGRGLAEVLGDLAAIGFDAEWHCIPASAVGAPHRRDRIWIVAYPCDSGLGRLFQSQRELWCSDEADVGSDGEAKPLADSCSAEWWPHDAPCGRVAGEVSVLQGEENPSGLGGRREDVADAVSKRLQGAGNVEGKDCGRQEAGQPEQRSQIPHAAHYAADSEGTRRSQPAWWWWIEPDVGRVANGVPSRVDRLRCLGNAVVPQIPEIIGRAIMKVHREQ